MTTRPGNWRIVAVPVSASSRSLPTYKTGLMIPVMPDIALVPIHYGLIGSLNQTCFVWQGKAPDRGSIKQKTREGRESFC